jgi:hypothetical protein
VQVVAEAGETLDTFVDKVRAGTVAGVHDILSDHSAQRPVKVVISMMQNECGSELEKMAALCQLLRE